MMSDTGALLYCCILLLATYLNRCSGAVGGIETIPKIDVSDDVHFYWLEGAFPYNVPEGLKNKFARTYIQSSPFNAALGVWDVTNDVKFSIEFVCSEYTGSVLPSLTSGNKLSWNNTGSILVTNPLNEEQWIISRHISQTKGGPYEDLMYFIKNTLTSHFTTYQPITVLYPEFTKFNLSTIDGSQTTSPGLTAQQLEAFTAKLVPSSSSYDFLATVVDQLYKIGIVTAVFVNTYSSVFAYFSATSSSPPVVSWTLGGEASKEVYQWYERVERCLAASVVGEEDYSITSSTFLLSLLQPCYNTTYAYVYKSANSVYNITLFNSSLIPTPSSIRVIYNLPGTEETVVSPLSAVDVFVIVAFFLSVPVFAVYIFYRIKSAHKDNSIHKEGAKLIQSIVHDHMDDDGIFDYFTQRTTSAKSSGMAMKTLDSVFNRKPSKPSLSEMAIEEMNAGNTALMNARSTES